MAPVLTVSDPDGGFGRAFTVQPGQLCDGICPATVITHSTPKITVSECTVSHVVRTEFIEGSRPARRSHLRRNRLVKFIGVTKACASMSERISVLLSASQEPILVNAIDQTLALQGISRRSMTTRTCCDNPTACPCEAMNEGATGYPPTGSSGIFLTHVHYRKRLTSTAAIIRT